jgi:hypothetical protein
VGIIISNWMRLSFWFFENRKTFMNKQLAISSNNQNPSHFSLIWFNLICPICRSWDSCRHARLRRWTHVFIFLNPHLFITHHSPSLVHCFLTSRIRFPLCLSHPPRESKFTSRSHSWRSSRCDPASSRPYSLTWRCRITRPRMRDRVTAQRKRFRSPSWSWSNSGQISNFFNPSTTVSCQNFESTN